MKKQNYGRGRASAFPLITPKSEAGSRQRDNWRTRTRAAKNKGKTHWDTHVKHNLWIEFTHALHDYIDKRGNGEAQDNPKNAAGEIIDFPVGGDFGDWKNPKDGLWHIRYTEGLNDKAWMEERDRNYILRLEREGRLLDVEPNADKEIVADHKFRQEIVDTMKRARRANSLGAAAAADTTPPSSAKEKEVEQQQTERKAQEVAEEVKRQEAERKAKEQAEKARHAKLARRQAAEEQQRRAEAEQQQRLLQFQQYCRENGLAKLAKENNLDGIHYLLTLQDINLNEQDDDDCTALHYCATAGHFELVKTLVEKGANILLEDGLDQTARDRAKENKHIDIAAYLKKAEKTAQQREQQSPQPIPIRQPNPPQQPISPYVWGPGGGNPAGGDAAEPRKVMRHDGVVAH